MILARLERATLAFGGQYSIQLSYRIARLESGPYQSVFAGTNFFFCSMPTSERISTAGSQNSSWAERNHQHSALEQLAHSSREFPVQRKPALELAAGVSSVASLAHALSRLAR